MPSDAPGEPTHRVVLQRVRNRIIEYLELASSFEEQRTYQSRVPVSVPNEVINIWEDWFSGDNELVGPVFTREERDALDAFHRTWQNVAHSAPDPLPALTEVQSLPHGANFARPPQMLCWFLAVEASFRKTTKSSFACVSG